MDNIYEIIWNNTILDSEIIQKMEFAKCNNPKFDINLGCSYHNWLLLMYAVDLNRKELVRYLLSDPNVNLNHRSSQGNTALYFCKQVSILKLLLGYRDLDVNIQNDWGWTGLHRACYSGRKVCVKEYLLDARVDVLIRDNEGRTARDIALSFGYPGIAKIIRNSGRTSLLRIPNRALLHDIVRMIIEEYM